MGSRKRGRNHNKNIDKVLRTKIDTLTKDRRSLQREVNSLEVGKAHSHKMYRAAWTELQDLHEQVTRHNNAIGAVATLQMPATVLVSKRLKKEKENEKANNL